MIWASPWCSPWRLPGKSETLSRSLPRWPLEDLEKGGGPQSVRGMERGSAFKECLVMGLPEPARKALRYGELERAAKPPVIRAREAAREPGACPGHGARGAPPRGRWPPPTRQGERPLSPKLLNPCKLEQGEGAKKCANRQSGLAKRIFPKRKELKSACRRTSAKRERKRSLYTVQRWHSVFIYSVL